MGSAAAGWAMLALTLTARIGYHLEEAYFRLD